MNCMLYGGGIDGGGIGGGGIGGPWCVVGRRNGIGGGLGAWKGRGPCVSVGIT